MMLHKMKLAFNNLKIRNKLIFIYLLAGLIPMLIVSIFLTSSMRSMLIDRATEEAQTNIIRLEERLLEVCKTCTDVSDGLYLDKKLVRIVTTQYESELQLIKDLDDYTAMDEYLRAYTELTSIRFFVKNKTLLNDSRIIKLTQEDEKSDWYNKALALDGRIMFTYRYDDIARANYLSLIRKVKSSEGQLIGVLVINIDNRYIKKVIDSEPFDTFIMMEDNEIIYTNNTIDDIKIGQKIETNNVLYPYISGENSTSEIDLNGQRMMVVNNTILISKTQSKMKIMTLIPVNVILAEANRKSAFSGMIIVISGLISFIFIWYTSKSFANRINFFRLEMHKAATGDFQIVENLEGKDEVGELYQDLTQMVQSFKQLIYENYEQKLIKEQIENRQREVEFKMLASQINPHFLYNTLETIRMKAYINGQREIADIVKKVAKITRRNLEISHAMVPLSYEIEFIQNYLDIQKFRFGDKVNFDIQVAENIEHYQVLPLLLQPIVENAFIHGLEKKSGSGLIKITIDKMAPNLHICVADDGIGMDLETLMKLQYRLDHYDLKSKTSIGMSNVNQRLKLSYGVDYGIVLKSNLGMGTQVDFLVPIQTEE